MPKFEIEFEITGLKLKIKGERQDVPMITQNLAQQVAGMLQPAANISGSETSTNFIDVDVLEETSKPDKKSRKKSTRKVTNTTNQFNGTSSKAIALDWIHNPEKWGTPQQSWSTTNKCIWLLYVVSKELSITELTQNEIAETFNKHFKQAKMIRGFTIKRDLGRAKTRIPSPVSENTTKAPETWFLTQTGEQDAQKLVLEALGKKQI